MLTQSFASILAPYKAQIEEKISHAIRELGPTSPLRDSCEYALSTGGKRFRPALVLMIANALGHQADVSDAALGVEFFHTASLVADDLPCMDNDDERRNQPTVHKKFGESTALLTTYALIAAGYESLAKNAHKIKHSALPFAHQADQLGVMALENATYNTGILGATGGQFLDLYPPELTLENVIETIHKKTVTLFEVSFVLGWLFGGGEMRYLAHIKKAAKHFGLAFQFADDIGDMEQDKANGRLINLANVYGYERAKRMFHEEIQEFNQALQVLNIESSDIQALVELLKSQIS